MIQIGQEPSLQFIGKTERKLVAIEFTVTEDAIIQRGEAEALWSAASAAGVPVMRYGGVRGGVAPVSGRWEHRYDQREQKYYVRWYP